MLTHQSTRSHSITATSGNPMTTSPSATLLNVTAHGEHPTHRSIDGLGGFKTVETIALRDSIPDQRRENGMRVNVTNDLDPSNNGDWELTLIGWQRPAVQPQVANQLEIIQTEIDAITADPINAVSEIWIPATALSQVNGSNATPSNISNRLAAWLLPNAAASFLSVPIRLPSHWHSYQVDWYLVNTASNAGNLAMQAQRHDWALNESINVTPTGSSSTVVANSTAGIVFKGSTATALTVDSSKTTTLRIVRLGTSASDTLPNPIALIGVSLRKVS